MKKAETAWERVFDIQVALRIIKHISSGIYRRPAGALKELVSNSFDSDASEVTIDTDYPKFREIRVRDNGLGMTKETVEKSFHNIGVSQKPTSPEEYKGRHARPLIGKFGIGMLASAHASRDIVIRTFTKTDAPGLEIELDLNPYFEFVNQVRPLDEFQFGTVKYREIPNAKNERGSEIVLTKVDPTGPFRAVLAGEGKSLVKWPRPGEREQTPGNVMDGFVRELAQSGLLTTEPLCGREQILWDLGVMCPVDYLNEGPIAPDYLDDQSRRVIDELKARVHRMDFKLFFDGVEVRKPILLPTPKRVPSTIDQYDPTVGSDVKVWTRRFDLSTPTGRRVKATGYLLYQPNRVTPGELRGLYPRVAGVGVGLYENTFFRGIRTENPVFRVSVSGEIYIEEGLDDALDLDRSGFMELDPEFRVLQAEVSKWVGAGDSGEPGLSSQAKSASRERNKRRRVIKDEIGKDARQRKTSRVARKVGVPFSAAYSPAPPPSTPRDRVPKSNLEAPRPPTVDYTRVSAYPSGNHPIVTIYTETETIALAPEFKDPILAGVIIAAHKVLGESKDATRLRRAFADALAKIL